MPRPESTPWPARRISAPLWQRALLCLPALWCLGCSSMRMPVEFVERVESIEQARIERSVQALHELGPRPIENVAATNATVAWLRAELEALGYAVSEEPVSTRTSNGRLVANVRKQGSGADGEQLEIELPNGFASYGARVLESQSRKLRAEGWEVLGYAMQSSNAEGAAPTSLLVAPNLYAEILGSEQPERVIEVSAHYDTVPGCSGASDNSSGVAALLEMARVFSGATPRKTIRLCFFAAEEAGLLGSRVHIQNIVQDGKSPVDALINLDSIGFASDAPDSQQAPVRIPLVTWMPSTGNFITVIGTYSTGWLGNFFEDAADSYVPELEYYSANRIGSMFADGHRSDHAHYWEAGIPAIFLTDTGEFRSDNYHRPDDTPDSLNFPFVRQVAVAAAAAALELADR